MYFLYPRPGPAGSRAQHTVSRSVGRALRSTSSCTPARRLVGGSSCIVVRAAPAAAGHARRRPHAHRYAVPQRIGWRMAKVLPLERVKQPRVVRFSQREGELIVAPPCIKGWRFYPIGPRARAGWSHTLWKTRFSNRLNSSSIQTGANVLRRCPQDLCAVPRKMS